MSMIVGICSTRHPCLAVKRSVLPALQWQLAQPRLPILYSTRLVSKESMKVPDSITDKGAQPSAADKNAPTDRPLPWFGSGASTYESAKTFNHPDKFKKDRAPRTRHRPIIVLSVLVFMFYLMLFHDEQENSEVLNASMYPVLGGPSLEKIDLRKKIHMRRLIGKETILEEYRLAEIEKAQKNNKRA